MNPMKPLTERPLIPWLSEDCMLNECLGAIEKVTGEENIGKGNVCMEDLN